MSLKDQLTWVPSKGRYALLYCLDGESWFSLKKADSEQFVTRMIPSSYRQKDDTALWGQDAAVWRGRDPQLRSLFARCNPVEARSASQFLRWVRSEHGERKAPKKLYVTRPLGAAWGDELWTQTLDSTPFRLAGFVTPLQRALALQRSEWSESEHHRVLWLQVESEGLRWAATRLEGEPLTGWDPRLSSTILQAELGRFVRREVGLELGEPELRRLLTSSGHGQILVAGGHVGSGLPAQRGVNLSGFWTRQSGLRNQVCEVLEAVLDRLQGSPSQGEHFREQAQARGYTLLLDGPAWPLLLSLSLARTVV